MSREERKEQEKEFKKKYIIEAAKKVFAEIGFENTTMTDIAKTAGFAKGTLYLYFEDKNDLLMAVKGDVFEAFLEQLAGIAEKEAPALVKLQEIRAVYQTFHFNQLQKLGIMEVFSCHNFSRLVEKHDIVQRVQQNKTRMIGCFTRIISQGQNEGILRKDLNPDLTALLIDALFFGIMKNIMVDREFLGGLRIEKDQLLNAAFEMLAAAFRTDKIVENKF